MPKMHRTVVDSRENPTPAHLRENRSAILIFAYLPRQVNTAHSRVPFDSSAGARLDRRVLDASHGSY